MAMSEATGSQRFKMVKSLLDSSPQKVSLSRLVRVQRLEQMIREKRHQPDSSPVRFKEYKMPKHFSAYVSLQDFVDLFLNCEKDTKDYSLDLIEYRLIWIDNVFVRVQKKGNTNPVRTEYQTLPTRFGLTLNTPDDVLLTLVIHAGEREDAFGCLEMLLCLRDGYFKKMKVVALTPAAPLLAQPQDIQGVLEARRQRPQLLGRRRQDQLTSFPLSGSAFAKVLQNEERELCFENFQFSSVLTQNIISCPHFCRLAFEFCEFLPPTEGSPPIQFPANNERKGPITLYLWMQPNQYFLGSATNWASYMRHSSRLERLTILETRLADPELCRAIAEAPVKDLQLDNVDWLENEGALVEAIQKGVGPKRLHLISGHEHPVDRRGLQPFGTLSEWRDFLRALSGNSNIEHLTLTRIDLGSEEWSTLAAAMDTEKYIITLSLQDISMDCSCWDSLMSSISRHPRLVELNLKIKDRLGAEGENEREIELALDQAQARRSHRTQSVKAMLMGNRHIDTMVFDHNTYDSDYWLQNVEPLLKRNLFRKRYEPIQNMADASLRASIIGEGLGVVRENPSLIWMMLSMNQDIISANLMGCKEIPALSRKRRMVDEGGE